MMLRLKTLRLTWMAWVLSLLIGLGPSQVNASINIEIYEFREASSSPIEPEMVDITGGRFQIGQVNNCSPILFCLGNMSYEASGHWVTIKPFNISKYEVTFEEYAVYVDSTGVTMPSDYGWGRKNRPVMNISLPQALAYIHWLNNLTGKNYRLPTEAEWEFVAREGHTLRYSRDSELEDVSANCKGCGSIWGGEQTAPVGSFSPNELGVHDLYGNVTEWVQDCWNESVLAVPKDGTAQTEGDCSKGVLRGGTWDNTPYGALLRTKKDKNERSPYSGFRLVLDE